MNLLASILGTRYNLKVEYVYNSNNFILYDIFEIFLMYLGIDIPIVKLVTKVILFNKNVKKLVLVVYSQGLLITALALKRLQSILTYEEYEKIMKKITIIGLGGIKDFGDRSFIPDMYLLYNSYDFTRIQNLINPY